MKDDDGPQKSLGPENAKGKAKEEKTESSRIAHQGEKTFASRVADSAASLAGSLLPSGTAVNDAAQVLASSKAESSGAARPTVSGDLSARKAHDGLGAVGRTDAEKFRSTDLRDHIAQQEAAFADFLDGTAALEPGTSRDFEEVLSNSHEPVRRTASRTDDCTEHTKQDGAAVVSLLNGDMTDAMLAPEPGVALSREQEAVMRHALFGDGQSQAETHSRSRIEHVLDFFPEFLSTGTSGADPEELSRHFGVTDPVEARSLWVDQWQAILSSYTDEVWGDLEPLVNEAKQELVQLQHEPQTPSNVRALQRLRQLLGHLRGQLSAANLKEVKH